MSPAALTSKNSYLSVVSEGPERPRLFFAVELPCRPYPYPLYIPCRRSSNFSRAISTARALFSWITRIQPQSNKQLWELATEKANIELIYLPHRFHRYSSACHEHLHRIVLSGINSASGVHFWFLFFFFPDYRQRDVLYFNAKPAHIVEMLVSS